MDEFEKKLEALRALLRKQDLQAVVLTRVSSFAWATCGAASYVGTAASDGIAALVITPQDHYVVTNNIEARRLEVEEGLGEQGWEFIVHPWYGGQDPVLKLTDGLKVGTDHPAPGRKDLSVELARLRSTLTHEEGQRFRVLGNLCSAAMDTVMHAIQPGQSERQITARLAEQTELRGVQPVTIMVATDERIYAYRHPIPKDKLLDKYAMVILCGRKWGLVCSMTRSIHFGRMPDVLRQRMQSCARVDAVLIRSTVPGRSLGSIFADGQLAYAGVGYPDEWRLHHQGGSAGYEPREFVAIPGHDEVVQAGQAFAWNPSIQGVKSEDTILVAEHGSEILTGIPGWPLLEVETNGQQLMRPAIMEIE